MYLGVGDRVSWGCISGGRVGGRVSGVWYLGAGYTVLFRQSVRILLECFLVIYGNHREG